MVAETAEGVDKLVGLAVQSCSVGTVDKFSQLVGHAVDGEASLKPDAHGEMSASRLRRGGLPDEIGTRCEHPLVQCGDSLTLAGDLPGPQRSFECLVQEPWKVGAISIERLDQTEHGCIETFDDLRKRLLVNGPLSFFLGGSPRFAGVAEILPSVIAFQDALVGQPLKDLGNGPDEATFQRSCLGRVDERSPLLLSPIDLVEHHMDNETFDVYEGAPGAPRDIRELFACNHFGCPI